MHGCHRHQHLLGQLYHCLSWNSPDSCWYWVACRFLCLRGMILSQHSTMVKAHCSHNWTNCNPNPNSEPQDLIVNSPLQLWHISLYISYENLVLDQDNNFYLTSLSILMTCLLDNVQLLQGEVTCWSLLGVEGLHSLERHLKILQLTLTWLNPLSILLFFKFTLPIHFNRALKWDLSLSFSWVTRK